MSSSDLTFNIEITGFAMGEIDLWIVGLNHPQDADAAEAQKGLPSGPAITRLGDVWVLGDHRIACGSTLEAAILEVLMGGQRAAMGFCDPPYNVVIKGNVGGLGHIQHREFAMASGEMSPVEFTGFLHRALGFSAAASVDGSLHYVCMDWRHQRELLEASDEVYSALKNVCVWDKGVGGMGSLYRSQHELIYVFKKGDAPHRNNVQLGQFGRNRTNVWKYPGANAFSRSGDEGNLLALHPTIKPTALIADAMLDASARGDIVLDAFLGSGSTIIAAERVGRRGFGIELDPLYVDVAVRRWQRLTGGHARQALTGERFDDRAPAIGGDHVK